MVEESPNEYREGTSVWVWLPDLAQEVATIADPAKLGWYPAEITAVDESTGVLCLAFHAGGRVADVMIDLGEAWMRIYPHPEPPPPTYLVDLALRLRRALGEPGADLARKCPAYGWSRAGRKVSRVCSRAEARSTAQSLASFLLHET